MKILELGKYELCKIRNEDGTREQSLREFLIELFVHCHSKDSYCYEYMLPFDRKAAEAKKLHVFLQEQDILKSGVLALQDCDSDDAVKKALKKDEILKDYTEGQKEFILKAVQGLCGGIRSFEKGSKMDIGFVDFYSLEDRPEDIPQALDFFSTWHLDHFLTLKEADKGWWDWNAFAVAMIGLAQVIAGVALITLTAGLAAQFGSALIAEGINDMVYATIAGLTGTFSWKDYAIQKVISVAISIATGGLGALATPVKIAVKVGSAARFSTFAKTMAKAAGEFALNATAGIISDVVLADVQERVVSAIIEGIEQKLFSQISAPLHSRLAKMAAQEANDDDFHTKCQEMKKNFETAFGQNARLPEVFEQLRSQVASSLKQSYSAMADNLSKSKSKWAKLVGTGTKAAVMADQVYRAVDAGLNTLQAVDSLVELVGAGQHSSAQLARTDVDEALVERELQEIKECFEKYIQTQLQKKLKGVLESIIKRSMKKVASAGKKTVSASTQKAFHGKTTSQVVKDLHQSQPTSPGQSPRISTQAEKKQHDYQQRRETFQDTILKPQRKSSSEKSDSKVKHISQAIGSGSVLPTSQAASSLLPNNNQYHQHSQSQGKSQAKSENTSNVKHASGGKDQHHTHMSQDVSLAIPGVSGVTAAAAVQISKPSKKHQDPPPRHRRHNSVGWGDHLVGFQTRVGPGINQKFHKTRNARMFRAEEAIHPQYSRFRTAEEGVGLRGGRALYASIAFDGSSDHATYFAQHSAMKAFADRDYRRTDAEFDWSGSGLPTITGREWDLAHPPSDIKSVRVPHRVARDILLRTEPQNPKSANAYRNVNNSFSERTKSIIKSSNRARYFRTRPLQEATFDWSGTGLPSTRRAWDPAEHWHVQSADPTKGENLFAIHKRDIANVNRKGEMSDFKEYRGGFRRHSFV